MSYLLFPFSSDKMFRNPEPVLVLFIYCLHGNLIVYLES